MNKDKFFEWDKIEVRGSRTGTKKTTCPACSHTRKKKKDPCLYVNFDSGIAKCYHCERLSFKEDNRQAPSVKEYLLPSQDWHNHTNLSDGLVKWCSEKRNIKQQTLIDFGISEEKQYIPQIVKEANCIVFNYFEGGQVVNKKYRDGRKNFTQSKGGKPIFYNINSVVGSERVYIVEGEFDVLAMYEAGIKNVISLPSGANDNDDYWQNSKPYLDDVKEFIIAVDNDEKGKVIRDKIAHRLGKWRCKYIEWSGKDANEDLINGKIWESVKNEQKFPVSGTLTVNDLRDEVLQLYENGFPDTYTVNDPSFGGFKDSFKIMRGQLTTVTGIPSHGKSTFLEYYLTLLSIENNFKMSYYSPEHGQASFHLTKFIQSAIGKPFFGKKASRSDVERFFKWSDQKIYFTQPEQDKLPTFDNVLEIFKEQVYSFGIDVFVIDAFNKLILPDGMGEVAAIRQVLAKMTDFCQKNNVMLFLVAHPTKMNNKETGNQRMPNLYDVAGSADFYNQTHNGYTIHRNFADNTTTFVNLKTKFSTFQGNIGDSVIFRYDVKSGRYHAQSCHPMTRDLTEEYKQEQSKIEIDEDFGHIEQAPF